MTPDQVEEMRVKLTAEAQANADMVMAFYRPKIQKAEARGDIPRLQSLRDQVAMDTHRMNEPVAHMLALLPPAALVL